MIGVNCVGVLQSAFGLDVYDKHMTYAPKLLAGTLYSPLRIESLLRHSLRPPLRWRNAKLCGGARCTHRRHRLRECDSDQCQVHAALRGRGTDDSPSLSLGAHLLARDHLDDAEHAEGKLAKLIADACSGEAARNALGGDGYQ